MVAVSFSETLVHFYQITRHQISEHNILHSNFRVGLKAHSFRLVFVRNEIRIVDLKKRRLLGSHYVAVFIKDIWQRYIPQYTLHTQPREGHEAQNTAVDKIFCANRET
jgi:hypothetical protein